MSEYYNTAYFEKFRHISWWKKLFIGLVDRKEPLFRYVKSRLKSKSRLLDVGCGSGLFLHHAEKYFECVGIDISRDALKMAAAHAPVSRLIKASAYQLNQFSDKSFDVVSCFDTIEHILDLDSVFDEFYRVLSDQGMLAISVPNAESAGRSLKWFNWVGFRDPSHLWHLTHGELSRLLGMHGFVPMKVWFNGLNDTPYFGWLPLVLQDMLIKYPTQLWSLMGLPLPAWAGETFFVLLVKNPGWKSEFRQTQQRLLKRQRKEG